MFNYFCLHESSENLQNFLFPCLKPQYLFRGSKLKGFYLHLTSWMIKHCIWFTVFSENPEIHARQSSLSNFWWHFSMGKLPVQLAQLITELLMLHWTILAQTTNFADALQEDGEFLTIRVVKLSWVDWLSRSDIWVTLCFLPTPFFIRSQP